MTQTATPPELRRQINNAVSAGDRLARSRQSAAACDQWLLAWAAVQQLTTPACTSTEAFERQHPGLHEPLINWCSDLEMELGNAGLADPRYHQERLRYVREFLACFPQEDALTQLNMRRAEGDALWALGQQNEAEAVFAALVAAQSDAAWAYIGWADRYWLLDDSPKAYDTAEAIMQRALARPGLHDRADLLERLADLYDEWGKPVERDAVLAELEAAANAERDAALTDLDAVALAEEDEAIFTDSLPVAAGAARARRLPGRNEPCWCGSGQKYKRCHLRSDQQAGQMNKETTR